MPAPFYAPHVRSGFGFNVGGGGDLGSLDYTFRDSRSFGGAAARIVWTRTPGDVSNDVGDLAGRSHRAIQEAMRWGATVGPTEATGMALSKWEVHTKMAAYQFEGRVQNRGSSYGFNLAYGAGVEARGFQYGFALEAGGTHVTGAYGHDTKVISDLMPDLGRRAMTRAVRNMH